MSPGCTLSEQRLVVVGSQQMASFDDVAKRLVLYDQRVELQAGEPVPVQGPGEEVPFADEDPCGSNARPSSGAGHAVPPHHGWPQWLAGAPGLAGGATLPGNEW